MTFLHHDMERFIYCSWELQFTASGINCRIVIELSVKDNYYFDMQPYQPDYTAPPTPPLSEDDETDIA